MPITVAIVEDDPAIRAFYAQWLRQADDFKLLGQFQNGTEALQAIPLAPPDVVLMDINIPEPNGVECVRRLKLQLPAAQFVMITSYEDTDSIFAALAAGATGYLLKETRQQDLLTALRDVHQGGSPMSSSIARKVVQCFHPTQKSAADPQVPALSQRELEVLDLLARGYLCKEISERLHLSAHTVDTYLRRIYEKLHVHSRAQATARYKELQPHFRNTPNA